MSKMSLSDAGRLGSIKATQNRHRRYALQPNKCQNCLEDLPYKQRHNKFCGHSCAAKKNNLGSPHNFVDGIHAKKPCRQCGQVTTNAAFCSMDCSFSHKWSERKKNIDKTGHERSCRTAKRYLLETRGVKCEVCGIEEWMNQPVPLVMDHIDGDSGNNCISNLRLVCGNCDMQLPTYKSKNIGNGRHKRRQRYRDGKSY